MLTLGIDQEAEELLDMEKQLAHCCLIVHAQISDALVVENVLH